ncbi:MAG: GTPase HflX [Chloroflexota bacterium]|nr:GTPase HflX [Caldilinea sp.]GIK71093.1 MAG: GTPase HflX [Chloroflexota bacterium]
MTNPGSFQSQGSLASDGRGRDRIVRDEAGLVSTAPVEERAILVGVELQNQPSLLALEDSLDELALLAKTAGVHAIARITQRLESPNPATLIGVGKVEELRMAVTELGANVVIFDDELSPRQQRELEKALGEEVKVVDRTALILDIFARHARTREGAVQVELAQYEYRLPRLTRAWTHLARQAGGRAGGASGGVGVRGPGETQLEVDRREINRRIAFLKQQLAEISKYRQHYRSQRRQSAMPVVAVVGYTNAGKSTLLNAIANADVLAEDQLFATLDPTTRRVRLPSDRLALFSDTVGFIQKLPTQLVAAFRSTLEEVNEADLLLHVVDISHANMEEQMAAVEEILDDLGAADKPMVVALNKIDRLDRSDPDDAQILAQALADNPNAVPISALNGEGLDRLLEVVDAALRERMARIDTLIPYSRGDLVAMLHEYGTVEMETHTEHGTHVVGRLPLELVGRLEPYWTANQASVEM